MADENQVPSSQSSENNRRATRRGNARTSVAIEVRKGTTGLGANLAAQFVDISEGGVRVILGAQLPLNSSIEIVLTGHGIRKPIKRVAEVRWIETLDAGRFLAGLRFDKPLTHQDAVNFAKPR